VIFLVKEIIQRKRNLKISIPPYPLSSPLIFKNPHGKICRPRRCASPRAQPFLSSHASSDFFRPPPPVLLYAHVFCCRTVVFLLAPFPYRRSAQPGYLCSLSSAKRLPLLPLAPARSHPWRRRLLARCSSRSDPPSRPAPWWSPLFPAVKPPWRPAFLSVAPRHGARALLLPARILALRPVPSSLGVPSMAAPMALSPAAPLSICSVTPSLLELLRSP
jgi:hypothetical protein